jgi:hypothetical protein
VNRNIDRSIWNLPVICKEQKQNFALSAGRKKVLAYKHATTVESKQLLTTQQLLTIQQLLTTQQLLTIQLLTTQQLNKYKNNNQYSVHEY